MAAKDLDQKPVNPLEREIPVFTVSKNNSILKNIFILDNPPTLSSRGELSENQDSSEIEEILVVGRHPDCNIKLEHPSISRFHLQINSKPSSRSLFVTDLSSVHGTWISGKKVMPGVKVKLNEGETLSLGSSSRLYQLNWVPYSLAYDVDYPFVPQLDNTADSVEQEKELDLLQTEKSEPCEDDQVHNLTETLKGLELLFPDENEGSSSKEGTSFFGDSYDLFWKKDEYSDDQEDEIPSLDGFQYENENCPSIINFPSPDSHKKLSEQENETTDMDLQKMSDQSIWSRRGKSDIVKVETNGIRRKNTEITMSLQIQSIFHANEYNVANPGHSEKIYTPEKENRAPDFCLKKCKSGKFSKRTSVSNSPLSDHDEEEIFTPDKENMTPLTRALRFKKNSGVLEEAKVHNPCKSSPLKRAGNSNMNQEESTVRSLVKECKYQTVLQERKIASSELKSCGNLGKQSAVLNSIEDREPFRPLSLNSLCIERLNSNKPHVHEVNGRGSGSVTYACYEEVDHSHVNMKKEKKKWTIIVDTGCLLNSQSRTELQLLRGLKGTTMIIPRIVVRELDCMLRQRSFFKRTNEVSSALQWIDDCTSNTKWWIHVQSSAEENTLIPPTPSASSSSSSPQWFNGEPYTFSPFSLREIATPTPEDHILECALHFKQVNNDKIIVLLSNNVTLKIKAMANGVICETVEEFRRSLVNPFSKRFMFTDSSPRGPTWSCGDDTVLKEIYYPSPSKKLTRSGESVKGLKLILLHNPKFGQITQQLVK